MLGTRSLVRESHPISRVCTSLVRVNCSVVVRHRATRRSRRKHRGAGGVHGAAGDGGRQGALQAWGEPDPGNASRRKRRGRRGGGILSVAVACVLGVPGTFCQILASCGSRCSMIFFVSCLGLFRERTAGCNVEMRVFHLARLTKRCDVMENNNKKSTSRSKRCRTIACFDIIVAAPEMPWNLEGGGGQAWICRGWSCLLLSGSAHTHVTTEIDDRRVSFCGWYPVLRWFIARHGGLRKSGLSCTFDFLLVVGMAFADTRPTCVCVCFVLFFVVCSDVDTSIKQGGGGGDRWEMFANLLER